MGFFDDLVDFVVNPIGYVGGKVGEVVGDKVGKAVGAPNTGKILGNLAGGNTKVGTAGLAVGKQIIDTFDPAEAPALEAPPIAPSEDPAAKAAQTEAAARARRSKGRAATYLSSGLSTPGTQFKQTLLGN